MRSTRRGFDRIHGCALIAGIDDGLINLAADGFWIWLFDAEIRF